MKAIELRVTIELLGSVGGVLDREVVLIDINDGEPDDSYQGEIDTAISVLLGNNAGGTVIQHEPPELR